MLIDHREIRHFHLFCGLGGGAAGFNRGQARIGSMQARFRCLGGVDSDARAIADFSHLAGVPGTVLDLFDRDQYRAFHGEEPPAEWREATPADIRKAAGNERPHIVFTSPPCKAFSGLLSENKSKTEKYQALNRLTVRGIWLTLEAWKDDLPEFVILENVPRIQNRGRHLLDQISGLLRRYGYAVAETTHDCGDLGGLAQSRKRFLLVARHMEKVPPFLYEPEKRPLLGVGDILGRMPLPGDPAGGVMHRVPSLQWKTWVRLAFVEAGSDWRSLDKLAVEDGILKDYLILPERRDDHRDGTGPSAGGRAVADPRFEGTAEYGQYGVRHWSETMGAVSGQSAPGGGRYAVADPRVEDIHHGVLGVLPWDAPGGAVTSAGRPMTGRFAVADPRHSGPAKHSNEFRIVPWSASAQAVTSAHGSGQCVADPRSTATGVFGKYAVTRWNQGSGTVISGSTTGQGDYAVADPRPNLDRQKGDDYLTAGHYGVVGWDAPSGAVSAAAGHDNGKWSVADPRTSCLASDDEPEGLPAPDARLVATIHALDGTWHRPFTTLELAALQGLVDPEIIWSSEASAIPPGGSASAMPCPRRRPRPLPG